MFRMYASNYHSYTHLILALGIVRRPTVWGFITSQYPICIHDIGLPNIKPLHSRVNREGPWSRFMLADHLVKNGFEFHTFDRFPPPVATIY